MRCLTKSRAGERWKGDRIAREIVPHGSENEKKGQVPEIWSFMSGGSG